MSDRHSQYYRSNTAYADFLASLPLEGYDKYIASLKLPGKKVLDVGCGVGAVVQALIREGVDGYGIDPCEPAIVQARQGCGTFCVGEAIALPFEDAFFDAVGSFTVLEHVEDPDTMLREMVRVLKPGGRIVIACPNFLRVVGLEAHHWHNRGAARKALNLMSLIRKGCYARIYPRGMAFEHMPAVVRSEGFEPDDDAITVTNAVDVKFSLRHTVRFTYHSGLITPGSPRLDRLAEVPILRTLIGGVFLVGERVA